MARITKRSEAIKLGWILPIAGGALILGLAVRFHGQAINNKFSSHEDFIRRLWASLSRVAPSLGTMQKTILIGQAIHEASWGVAKASREAFNYWNLTAGSKWRGPVLPGKDLEYDKAGNVKTITQAFRKYRSDDEAIKDMLSFIGPGSRYSEAWEALQKGNAMTYLAKLHEKGFFTQPLPIYQKATMAAIQQVVSILG